MALSPFQGLSASFGFETSKTLPELLAMLMSEQEAGILLATPGTPHVLARKLPYDVDRLAETLDDLYARGLVFIGEHMPDGPFYQLPDDVGCYMDSVLFDRHDDRLGTRYFDLWREFVNKEFFAAKENVNWGFRVIPVGEAIALESHVLPYEHAADIARGARRIALQPCPCRKRERRCDNPIETCVAFDELAEYAIYRQTGREINSAEATAILRRCAELGLMHQTANTDKPDVICNCCECCCVLLSPVLRYGMDQVISKSRFRSYIDYEACTDCWVCVDRCQFGALEEVGGNVVEARDPDHIPLASRAFHSAECRSRANRSRTFPKK